MLNKNCIKTILNVKHTCIDKVTMLADTSIMIEMYATKGEQCRCGICGKQSSPTIVSCIQTQGSLTSNFL